MKKKTMLMLTGALAIGVLSACGGSKENAHSDGHGSTSHQEENSATPSAGHGDHGDHGTSEQSANYKASFSFSTESVKANENSELHIQITDSDGDAVKEFELNHEKLMHLIVVSKDLSYFNHIHPNDQGDGQFSIGMSFPNGGEYKAFADFVPKAGTNTTLSQWVKVEGNAKSAEPVKADAQLTKAIDDKEIELTLSSTKANEEVTLVFNISDAQTKEGIRNLEQYLGAVGHVVILSEDAEQYLHVHPVEEKATGPKAEFMTSFPKSGTYKIWGQFQHQGKVFTVPFVVNIS